MRFTVKIGKLCLTLYVKIGYNISMIIIGDFLTFVLRILLIAVLWLFVWRHVKPTSQLMRVLRAALLVIVLLAVLTAIRITGAN